MVDKKPSRVEKLIKSKYGDIGLRLYDLVDGRKTTETIRTELNLTVHQLAEMLDFMDAQGIIKLDYPSHS